MPDSQTVLLPSRAYFLSMRDQNTPLREIALADAIDNYSESARVGGYGEHLALVALIGEALQIVEDVGALSSSLLDCPARHGVLRRTHGLQPPHCQQFLRQPHQASGSRLHAASWLRIRRAPD
jgi:hypothetical protein